MEEAGGEMERGGWCDVGSWHFCPNPVKEKKTTNIELNSLCAPNLDLKKYSRLRTNRIGITRLLNSKTRRNKERKQD